MIASIFLHFIFNSCLQNPIMNHAKLTRRHCCTFTQIECLLKSISQRYFFLILLISQSCQKFNMMINYPNNYKTVMRAHTLIKCILKFLLIQIWNFHQFANFNLLFNFNKLINISTNPKNCCKVQLIYFLSILLNIVVIEWWTVETRGKIV